MVGMQFQLHMQNYRGIHPGSSFANYRDYPFKFKSWIWDAHSR